MRNDERLAVSEEERPCAASGRTTIWVSTLVCAVCLYWVIAEPDAGGIWDGYVPTWLGGEGPEAGR